MNFITLKIELHNQLDELIELCEQQNPGGEMVDLMLSFLHFDGDDKSTTLNANAELIDLKDGSWEVGAMSIWSVKHIHHLDI